MHIHLPKPLHGWRELIGEVGVIVLGILIALAAEQAIEWAHWRHKAEQATEALRSGLEVNALNAIEQQVSGACIDRQLADLEARLTASGPYRPAPSFRENTTSLPFTVRAPTRPWTDDTWKVITSEGVATHLPASVRDRVNLTYGSLDTIRSYAREAEPLLWRLNSLALPMVSDPASRLRLAQDIEELRGRENQMTLVASQLEGGIADLGMMPSAARIRRSIDEESGTITFCRSHGLPLSPIKPIHSD